MRWVAPDWTYAICMQGQTLAVSCPALPTTNSARGREKPGWRERWAAEMPDWALLPILVLHLRYAILRGFVRGAHSRRPAVPLLKNRAFEHIHLHGRDWTHRLSYLRALRGRSWIPRPLGYDILPSDATCPDSCKSAARLTPAAVAEAVACRSRRSPITMLGLAEDARMEGADPKPRLFGLAPLRGAGAKLISA